MKCSKCDKEIPNSQIFSHARDHAVEVEINQFIFDIGLVLGSIKKESVREYFMDRGFTIYALADLETLLIRMSNKFYEDEKKLTD
jgi:hypothetical protein